MINKAIYTYWDCLRNGAGFKSIEDFLYMFSLSVNVSKKHFDEVEVYTDDFGTELLYHLGLPITITNKFKHLHLDKHLWAYPKLVSYAEQTKPFIHIDNDVILWDGLPDKVLGKDFIFQGLETTETNMFYSDLIKAYKGIIKRPFELNPKQYYAYNCGVVGCNDMDVMRSLLSCANTYLFSDENQEQLQRLMNTQNFFYEQYFLTHLINESNKSVGLLFDNPKVSECNFNGDYKYTHLWGNSKQFPGVIDKVKNRLLKDYPDSYHKIKELYPN